MVMYGARGIRTVDVNPFTVEPSKVLSNFVRHESGPTGSDDENMNCDGSVTPGIFSYMVPANTTMQIARLNIAIIDAGAALGRFGGIPKLTNGVLIQCVDPNGLPILNLEGGRAVTANRDFLFVAGVDMDIIPAMVDGDVGVVKVRYTIFRTGANMSLPAGESIRFTIRDDLTAIDEFRCMVQGTMKS